MKILNNIATRLDTDDLIGEESQGRRAPTFHREWLHFTRISLAPQSHEGRESEALAPAAGHRVHIRVNSGRLAF